MSGADEPRGYIRTYFIQLAILSCHQNGRDTHIRQIRVYSPAECAPLPSLLPGPASYDS